MQTRRTGAALGAPRPGGGRSAAPRGRRVGRHAAELISVLAVAVTNGLTVTDIHESLLVHPTLAEALTEAAE